jgi:ankyrin repeat protein
MDALLSLGANVNATYHGFDAATTPLALTAWFGDLEVAQYLVSKGADGTLKDSMGRNTLHGMTKYFPDRHGYLPHHWHAWVRQGNWSQHLEQIHGLTKLLVEAGADIDAKDNAYPSLTPVAAAADLGVWKGGVICALLEAGADLQEATLSMGDSGMFMCTHSIDNTRGIVLTPMPTVLHSWASIVGPRLDYPCSYMYTLRRVVDSMPDIDVRNRFESDTPLHSLATTYHPEDEFEEACEVLLSNTPAADLNAKTRRGATPLSIALETKDDPARRGTFLLKKGADMHVTNDQGKDIFFSIANNAVLHDQDTNDLIQRFLQHLDPNAKITKTYQQHFLPNPGSVHALFASADRGKPLTTSLLLTLGLKSRINDLNNIKSPPLTALDHALHSGELSRRAHMEKISTHKAGPAQRQAIQANLVFDDEQGPPSRAAEAYNGFPEVIRRLRGEGAKRACELDPVPDERLLDRVYIQQSRFWDWTSIYNFGFTPATQPDREHWDVLYELARYPAGWREKQVEELFERYTDGIWRPDVRFLEEEADRSFVEEVVFRIGRETGDDLVKLAAVDRQQKLEVEFLGGSIVSRRKMK